MLTIVEQIQSKHFLYDQHCWLKIIYTCNPGELPCIIFFQSMFLFTVFWINFRCKRALYRHYV